MALEIGQRYVGLRAKTHNGKIFFVAGDGECEDELQIGSRYQGLLAGTHNGKKFYVVGDQKLNEDGELIIGKRYIGLLSGTHNGKKLYTVSGKGDCDGGGDPPITDCDGCVRPAEINIAVARTITLVTEGCDGGPVECEHVDDYDGVLTWEELSFPCQLIDGSYEAPCDPEDVQCGDFCYEQGELTIEGYWSEEIEETIGWCDPCACTGRYIRRVRYVMMPNCSGEQWSLMQITLYEEFCDVVPTPNPNPAACLITDCQATLIDTFVLEDCEEINIVATIVGGSVTISE